MKFVIHCNISITFLSNVMKIVVLISLMAQPRLQYALAKDGLLPEIFARIDQHGNIWHGTLISGIVVILIASFVPFAKLNDMISAGILIAFCMTDCSLIIMRLEAPRNHSKRVERLLGWFNASAFLFGVCFTHFYDSFFGNILTVISILVALSSYYGLHKCPRAVLFGGSIRATQYKGSVDMRVDSYFKTPLMPFIPVSFVYYCYLLHVTGNNFFSSFIFLSKQCLGIFVNWYLISQLDLYGIFFLLAYLGIAALFYFSYGMEHSVGANGGWEQYETQNETMVNDDKAEVNEFSQLNKWSDNPQFRRSTKADISGSLSMTRDSLWSELPPLLSKVKMESNANERQT